MKKEINRPTQWMKLTLNDNYTIKNTVECLANIQYKDYEMRKGSIHTSYKNGNIYNK